MPLAAAAGIAAIGTIGGAALGASATKKAAKTAADAQTQAAAQNNALQREIYDRNTGNLSPFMERGRSANDWLGAFLGLPNTPDQGQANQMFGGWLRGTDYQFQQARGEAGLGARLSASGGVQSGAAQKALSGFNQGLQSQYRNDYVNALAGQQGVGLSAANALAGVGTNFANSVGSNNQNAADGISNSALLRGSANAGLYASAGNALGNFAGQAFGSSFGGGNSWNAGKDVWV